MGQASLAELQTLNSVGSNEYSLNSRVVGYLDYKTEQRVPSFHS